MILFKRTQYQGKVSGMWYAFNIRCSCMGNGGALDIPGIHAVFIVSGCGYGGAFVGCVAPGQW